MNIKFNNETIKNAIMDALDKMERGIEISEDDRNELINVILKYGDRDFGIKGNRTYTREELQNSIYIHINEIDENNKCYIGQTSQKPKVRWGCDGNGYCKCQLIYKAIKKYGWNNFSHIVLCHGLSKEQANEMEITLISLFKTTNGNFGYNIEHGGNSVGKTSEETINKISENRKGKCTGENNIKAKVVYCDGMIFPTVKQCAEFYSVCLRTMIRWLQQPNKITNSNSELMKTGGLRYATKEDIEIHPLYTEESENKISKVNTIRNNPGCKKVFCNGQIFPTIKKCAYFYNIHPDTMGNWLQGRRKTPCKFIELGLRYATQEDIENYPLYIEEDQ